MFCHGARGGRAGALIGHRAQLPRIVLCVCLCVFIWLKLLLNPVAERLVLLRPIGGQDWFPLFFCCIPVWDPGVILPRAHVNLPYNIALFLFHPKTPYTTHPLPL